jgi:hypothetical protein
MERDTMPIPTAILFGLASFAAVMALLGWALDPTAPTLGSWFVAKASEGGLWSGLFLFLLAVGYFTVRGHWVGPTADQRADNRADKGAHEETPGPG